MFQHLFHPTDFSPASNVAFAHALKLALATGGPLTILHVVGDGMEAPRSSFPHVRRTLAAWKLVDGDSRPEEVARLGIAIKKLEIEGGDPAKAIAQYLEGRQMDLVVLSTHQHGWLRLGGAPAVAESVMRSTQIPCLFIPPASDGFVRFEDGAVGLRRIIVPVAREPDPQAAVDAAFALTRLLGPDTIDATVLYVGAPLDAPRLHLPEAPGWTWAQVSLEGSVETTILEVVTDTDADLLVMTTHGPHGFLGALRGSTGSRLVRRCPCPVLAIPRP